MQCTSSSPHWYSFRWPRKDDRLSQPPGGLNQWPMGFELRTQGSQATTLTTKPTPGLKEKLKHGIKSTRNDSLSNFKLIFFPHFDPWPSVVWIRGQIQKLVIYFMHPQCWLHIRSFILKCGRNCIFIFWFLTPPQGERPKMILLLHILAMSWSSDSSRIYVCMYVCMYVPEIQQIRNTIAQKF